MTIPAKIKTQRIDIDTSGILDWFTSDPVGQKVGLGLAIVVGLVVLYFVLRSLRWAAARWKAIFAIAAIGTGLFYGSVYVFDLGPIGWLVAGGVMFGIVVALSFVVGRPR